MARGDQILLGAVACTSAIGISVLHTIDPTLGDKQLLWLCGACIAYTVVQMPVVAHRILRNSQGLFYCSLVVLGATTWIGARIGGAKSWLPIGTFSLQPIEIVKVTFVLYWASFVYRLQDRNRVSTALQVISSAAVVAILVLQRDLGPVLVFALTACLWSLSLAVSPLILMRFGLVFAISAWGAWSTLPHVRNRFTAWLFPWNDPFGVGYQTLQARLAMSRGGIVGRGWYAQLTEVPAAATDLPLVVVLERLGLLGAVIVVVVLGLVHWRMLSMAKHQSDPYWQHVSFGIALLVLMQSMLVVAGSLGIVPMVGLTLPFVSYGGSALTMLFVQLGLVAFMHRASDPPTPSVSVQGAPHVRRVLRALTLPACAVVISL